MSEQSKWNAFQQQKAVRRMKHDKNLPEDCQGCRAGIRWSVAEEVQLVGMLKPHMQMKGFCMALDRPASGIIARVRKLGLAYGYPLMFNAWVTAPGVRELDPLVVEALIKAGWEYGLFKRLMAPDWWCGAKFHYQGFEFKQAEPNYKVWGRGRTAILVSDMNVKHIKACIRKCEEYAENSVDNETVRDKWDTWIEVLQTELESRL